MSDEIIEEIEEIKQTETELEQPQAELESEEPEDDTALDTDDFIRELAERAGFTKGDTKIFLRAMQEIFEDAIIQNVSIRIRGFLNLIVKDVKGFKGVNAYKSRVSGEVVSEEFAPSKRVVITAGINLRDLLREPSKRWSKKKIDRE